MVVRLLIVILLVYVGIKTFLWVKRLSRARSTPRTVRESGGKGAVNDMVRDPVCGLYLPSDEAVTLERNGFCVYFCSEDCRTKYLQGRG